MSHRILTKGELIKEGDEYWDKYRKRWYPTNNPGQRVGIKFTTNLKYRRAE